MLLTAKALADRLRAARINAGLSQEVVATKLGLPRPAISQLESGIRTVSSIELSELARLYNRSVDSFLARDVLSGAADQPLTMLLRAANLQPEDLVVIEEFERLCRDFSNLEMLVGWNRELLLPDYSSFGAPRSKLDAIRQGEQVASEERRRLGIGDDPIRNIFDLLESQGIRLLVRALDESGISGLFLYDPIIGPCILINGSEHRNRLAVNCAHEYAHVLLDRQLRARISSASWQLGDGERNIELLESRANSFAAAFLLPAAGIERFLWDRRRTRSTRQELAIVDILHLQRAFGVSYQATLYRLQNLGWLDRGEREKLAEQEPERLARALGLPDDQGLASVNNVEGPYPFRYVSLALEAYRQAKITLDNLAQLLKKSIPETRDLLSKLGLPIQS